jgi:hypothetical protein
MISIWAISDLHLSFGTKGKEMDIFGAAWKDHAAKIAADWDGRVGPDDLVLVAGDISWAMTLDMARADLEWLAARPGIKVIIRGNHDYWWSSISKVRAALPQSVFAIQNDAFFSRGVAIAGTRLWDSPEYNFSPYIEMVGPALEGQKSASTAENDNKIFERELGRLSLSLQAMNKEAKIKIAMTHYPPIGASLEPSRASQMLEQAHIQYAIFGHLHSLKQGVELFGEKNGISYALSSCDYLGFRLLKVAEV